MDKLKTLFSDKFGRTMSLATIMFAVLFATTGCGAAANVSRIFADSSESNDATESAAQTNSKCREILKPANGDRLGSRGTFPAGFPAPLRGSTVCGEKKQPATAVPGSSEVYYLSNLSDDEILGYYRKALTSQGYRIDREEDTGGYKIFWYTLGEMKGGGTVSVITSRGNSVVDFFSVFYQPPTESNRTSNPSTNRNVSNSTAANDCGDLPIGSGKCAIELQKNLRGWQFSLEDTFSNGKRKTYAGEFLKRDPHVRIRVVLTGYGRDDGEWWFRFGDNNLVANDNGSRTYRKESGAWVQYRALPYEVGDILISEVSPIGEIDKMDNPVLIGTENVNGDECNHFRRVTPSRGDFYPESTTDYWISKRTGYCLRRRRESGGNIRLLNVSLQGEINNIESPSVEG